MTFLRVMVFSVLALLAFTGFANLLPQVQSDAPTDDETPTGAMDMPAFIAYGEELFSGAGTCTLCHNDLGRAPDMLNMDLRTDFEERLADPLYGGPKDIESYLRESMVMPSAYVVPGFGKKGTNDTESPMPAVDKPPIGLNDVQMDAIIAFLEDLAGYEPTVALPTGEAAAPPPEPATASGDQGEPVATTGEEAIDKYFCAACHDLQGSEADLGPDLRGVGARLGEGGIMVAILDPNAVIAQGYEPDIMPQDFAQQMSASELKLITDYLMNLPE